MIPSLETANMEICYTTYRFRLDEHSENKMNETTEVTTHIPPKKHGHRMSQQLTYVRKLHALSPTMSGRCAAVCPTFTKKTPIFWRPCRKASPRAVFGAVRANEVVKVGAGVSSNHRRVVARHATVYLWIE